jgi:WD40 repeat protein
LENGIFINKFIAHDGDVYSICCTSDSKYIFTCGEDDSVNMFDFNSLNLLFSFKSHSNIVKSICLSIDEKFIISGSNDETIKISKIPLIKDDIFIE